MARKIVSGYFRQMCANSVLRSDAQNNHAVANRASVRESRAANSNLPDYEWQDKISGKEADDDSKREEEEEEEEMRQEEKSKLVE